MEGLRGLMGCSWLVYDVEIAQSVLAFDKHRVVAVIVPPHDDGVFSTSPTALAVEVEGLAEVFILGLRDLYGSDYLGSKFHG